MNKDQRLTKATDFAAARREGESWSDNLLVLIARRNGLDVARFGFSVGKRVGKAVVRNKVRRRVREAARLTPVRSGWDLVFVARRDAASADFRQLRRSLTTLLRRSGLLGDDLPGPVSPPSSD
ncbi:MAG: ribonuclease P protein component [Chloroflexi bacterium]|nr:ribonuclease P protein component [Chloroflexota bacterium]